DHPRFTRHRIGDDLVQASTDQQIAHLVLPRVPGSTLRLWQRANGNSAGNGIVANHTHNLFDQVSTLLDIHTERRHHHQHVVALLIWHYSETQRGQRLDHLV